MPGRPRSAGALITLLASVVAEEECSCASLRSQVETQATALASLEHRFLQMSTEIHSLRSLARAEGGGASPTVQHAVNAVPGGGAASAARRELQMTSGGSTLTAVRSWQVHEFPSGHSCGSPGKAYLVPNMAAEGMTTVDYPTTSSADFSLMSNVDGASRSELQRVAAPLKVVHHSSCSAAPTLDLPLSTTVQTLTVSGTLTVSSIDVGAALSMSWVNLALLGGYVAHSSGSTSTPPSYVVRNGLVRLRGWVSCGGTCSSSASSRNVAVLPAAVRPPADVHFIAAATDNNYYCRLRVQAGTGILSVQTANGVQSFFLDAISWSIN